MAGAFRECGSRKQVGERRREAEVAQSVVVDWDMYAHALWDGGFFLEFVYRLCGYVMSCVI